MSVRTVIRFAQKTDTPQLVAFLDAHWRKEHIFVSHPALLEWQHTHPDNPDTNLTFVLAEQTCEDGATELVGVLGYMPVRRFDPSEDFTEIALAIWKVRDDIHVPGLGIQMLKTLQRMKPAMIFAVGTSDMVRPMYQALGYTVGAMDHVALFNEIPPADGSIALGIPPSARAPLAAGAGVALRDIDTVTDVQDIDSLAKAGAPRKSWIYLLNRYINHPYYVYTLKAVIIDGTLEAVAIWRRVATPQGAILRIVDVIGNVESLSHCGAHLRDDLTAAGCDYIDLMAWGVDMSMLCAGGFVTPAQSADLILPNYFAPFVQQNIRIELAVKCAKNFTQGPVRLYRADSDQDRPATPADLAVETLSQP